MQMILRGLKADLSVPVVIVQHISPGFINGLVRWLDETTSLPIEVAESSKALRPGVVYLAPDDRHLEVTSSGHTWLNSSPPVNRHRPSVTVLFESVAANYGSGAVGVILTGMGGDGASGLKALYDAGGYTIAQDESSCIVFGVPFICIITRPTRCRAITLAMFLS